MSGPGATMYSAGWNVTNQDQLKAANAGLQSATNNTTQSIQDALTKGLGLFNSQGTADQVNSALNTNNNLINNSQVAPGNVDMSMYNPYINAGNNALQQWQALSGITQGTGFNGQGQMYLAPGGVDVRPGAQNNTSIFDTYFNNPATQYQMQQGQNQINANYASKGLIGSGAMLKALQQNGQGIAAQNLGAAQQNLAQMAGMGATAANQYAANLLNKYQTDQQSAVAALQNKTQLAGQQAGLINANTNSAQAQTGLLQNLTNTQANLQQQAALAQQQALVQGATKYTETDQMGWGGARGSMNTSYTG